MPEQIIQHPTSPGVARIKVNTNILQEAKRRLMAHRDLLKKSRKAYFSTALYEVIQSFLLNGEFLPHLYCESGDGQFSNFLAELVRPHLEWIKDQQDRFYRMEGKEPDIGQVLSSAIMLRLPSDAPLLPQRHEPSSARRGRRETSAQSEADYP